LGGKITCTLGEVKNRADFIMYWGGNPAECHPRHFSKYTLTPKGKFVPEGRKGRTMVLVDIRETPSVKAADIFLQIRPGADFEVVTTLRALVKGQPVDAARVAERVHQVRLHADARSWQRDRRRRRASLDDRLSIRD
jgi:formylmethanofuran dehydrogenase subunit B